MAVMQKHKIYFRGFWESKAGSGHNMYCCVDCIDDSCSFIGHLIFGRAVSHVNLQCWIEAQVLVLGACTLVLQAEHFFAMATIDDGSTPVATDKKDIEVVATDATDASLDDFDIEVELSRVLEDEDQGKVKEQREEGKVEEQREEPKKAMRPTQERKNQDCTYFHVCYLGSGLCYNTKLYLGLWSATRRFSQKMFQQQWSVAIEIAMAFCINGTSLISLPFISLHSISLQFI